MYQESMAEISADLRALKKASNEGFDLRKMNINYSSFLDPKEIQEEEVPEDMLELCESIAFINSDGATLYRYYSEWVGLDASDGVNDKESALVYAKYYAPYSDLDPTDREACVECFKHMLRNLSSGAASEGLCPECGSEMETQDEHYEYDTGCVTYNDVCPCCGYSEGGFSRW